jgi:putative sigma-54 modulation protein
MDIRFSGKNLSVTNGMKEHLTEKLVKLGKYAPRLVEAHAILKKEKHYYEAEVTLLGKNLRVYGEARSKENVFSAIDQAYSRVEKQLKKSREKVKNHHKKGRVEKIPNRMEWEVDSGKPSKGTVEDRAIVRSPTFAPKPMSVEEASLQLELSAEPFLVFRDATHQKVSVIFKRADGNHGLVEPIL